MVGVLVLLFYLSLQHFSAIRYPEAVAFVAAVYVVHEFARYRRGRRRAAEAAREMAECKRIEEDLTRASEAALNASHMKSEFLASMSHEIRTPMNVIIGMTDLALATELTTEQREYLAAVRSSASALRTLVNDILDFAKIEAGRLSVETIPFSLRGTLSDALKPLAFLAHEKGLELVCDLPLAVPDALIGDPSRLRQIIVNLVANATKFTEAGEVITRVALDSLREGEAVLRFAVTDTGIGIPTGKQDDIFEAFTQADASTTRMYGGTGLGLKIASQLVELMGGRISIESGVGRGSTFHFTLHFALQKEGVSSPQPVQPADLRDLRVLVVDDHATARQVLAERLRELGMEPVAVEDGPAAVAALESPRDDEGFALAVIDAAMSRMHGVALARLIRLDPQLAGTAVVMLTSLGGEAGAALYREVGRVGCLTKPVVGALDLLPAIRAAFGRPAAKGRTPAMSPLPSEDLRHLRVLLAEDSPMNRTLVLRLLEKRGYPVVVAVGNGRDALAALEKERFDVVLMDVQMPEMDGFAATKAIRARERPGTHVPIIALTAHAMKGDRQRCLEAGMDAYIAKPIEPEQLFATIERQLPPAGAVEGASSPGAPAAGGLDRESLLRRVGGDPKVMLEIVALCLEDSRRMVGDLRAALSRHDSESVERAGHRLAGAVGMLGARGASQAALRLEGMGREGDLSQAEEAMSVLEVEVARLEREVAALPNG